MINLHKTFSNLALLGALAIAGCATSEHAPFVSGDEVSDEADRGSSEMAALGDSDEAAEPREGSDPTWARLAATSHTETSTDEESAPTNEQSALTNEESEDPTPAEIAEDEAIASNTNFFVYLKAAPADFDQVWVDISNVNIGTTGDDTGTWTSTMPTPRSVDLLTLQSEPTILGDVELQPGSYAQMRLFLSNPKIVSGTEYLPVFTQTALQSGIEIDLSFEVEEGVAYSLVLDFDASASFQEDGLGIHLRPVIRVASFTATGGSEPTTVDGGSPVTDPDSETASADAGAPAFDAGAGNGG
jgi:hypothetical protein